MLRPHLHDAIDALVQTRLKMRRLVEDIIYEMESGYRPTYRGHEWGPEHFRIAEQMIQHTEAAWHLAKWLQTPEMTSRLDDARLLARQALGLVAAQIGQPSQDGVSVPLDVPQGEIAL